MKTTTIDRTILKKAKGFWSGEDIYFNTTEKLVFLSSEPYNVLIKYIINYIDENLKEMIMEGACRALKQKYGAKRLDYSGFNFSKIPEVKNQIAWHNGGVYSPIKMYDVLIAEGKTEHDICVLLTNMWVDCFKESPYNGVNINLLSHHAVLKVPWKNLSKSSAIDFLNELYNLSIFCTDPGIFDSKYRRNGQRHPRAARGSSDAGRLLKKNLADERMMLIQKFSNIPIENIEDSHVFIHISNLSKAATSALLILRSKNCCLLPTNCIADASLMDRFGISTTVYGMEIVKNFGRTFTGAFYHFYVTSSISSLRDIPANLREIYEPYMKGFMKTFTNILKLYASDNELSVYPYQILKKSRKKEFTKYSLPWCEVNLPKDWVYLMKSFWASNNTSSRSKVRTIARYLSWAWEQMKYNSPWVILPENIRNPHSPGDNDTFYMFIKNKNSTQTRWAFWNSGELLYRYACNDSKLPKSPLYGKVIIDPFSHLSNPFKTNTKNKTPRPRIPQTIMEVMIDTLLEVDDNGTPTFAWAKTVTSHDKLITRDPHDSEKRIEEWNPSRACCLALLLLIPIRGVQARWLDQGLMDKIVYDPITHSMVKNTHPLAGWKYPEGDSHEDRYGRPSGIIQMLPNLLTGMKETTIFVNTNKTQLWDGSRKTGYEMPWPDGSEFLESDAPEIRQQGIWLRRIYEVILYQLRWALKFDPFPQPISFFHVHEDANRVDDQDEVTGSLPWFVPLFRDFTNHLTYKHNEEIVLAHGPVAKNKILKLYHALAYKTQERLIKKGVNANLVVTAKDTNGYRGHLCCYDIHTLRVAGISNLIEMGVPAHIVQEYIAGHATVLMTLRYLKFQPFYIRQKLLEAILNGNVLDTLDEQIQKIKEGVVPSKDHLIQHPRFQPHLEELPEDYTAFVLVPGGLCVMGGTGSRCDVGGVYHRVVENGKMTGEIVEEYGRVNGACGNCRFFVTGPAFLLHQALAANEIMLKMRAIGRERKRLFERIVKTEISIEQECVNSNKMELEKICIKERVIAIEETLRPMILEWFNRWQLFEESRKMLEVSRGQVESKSYQLITRLGEHDFDYSPETMETNDFGLVRQTVEQARFLRLKGIIIPDDQGRLLREFMDKILSQICPDNLLLKIKDEQLATEAASLLANIVAQMVGDKEAQRAIDSGLKLQTNALQEDQIRTLSSMIINATLSGSTPSPDMLYEINPSF